MALHSRMPTPLHLGLELPDLIGHEHQSYVSQWSIDHRRHDRLLLTVLSPPTSSHYRLRGHHNAHPQGYQCSFTLILRVTNAPSPPDHLGGGPTPKDILANPTFSGLLSKFFLQLQSAIVAFSILGCYWLLVALPGCPKACPSARIARGAAHRLLATHGSARSRFLSVTDWMAKFMAVKIIGSTVPCMYLDKRLAEDKTYGLSIFKTSDACMKWLDQKRSRSVIYVSFGSMAELGTEQTQELALALKETDNYFLWVARPSE
ncbi:UDP-Glycosyltransferase superfamily protein [Striga asiatica]|uniref:UDP-Glycosyltransferase superfamily protein n=1 Tax=Striga asiatica TaxID=4170 RepID=A0A5A7Q3Y7_STRAF|nr:UDP-Glycosyltransferase superfamily protein [Striga asiatica]